ncbi:MAG TPA: hypothetical protein VFU14_02215 [Acidimicrobiales bacterium]|nr:hypothetical protein [Acidimicrobiales bacterium]
MSMRRARAVGWVLGLVAAASLLRAAAGGELGAPPLTSLDGLIGWVDGRSPAAAAIAIVRLAAELSAWYVLGLSALHAVSHLLGSAGGHRVADALAVPSVRRAVRAGLGLGLVAASSVAGREAEPLGRGTATMVPAVEVGTATARPVVHGPGTATMRPVRDPRGTATMRPIPATRPGTVTAPAAPATWTVVAGESLWSIAEELLADAWGRPATDPEIAPYWQHLVAANRGRLVDPADPDLIHPGQVLEVPAVPSLPAV